MALFGQPYPIASEKREKLFGYSRPGGRLNAFDHELLSVSREFGSRQALAQRIAEYVNGKPALFGQPYVRDNDKRREVHFNGKWPSWDNKLSAMTGEFYAIG